MVSNESIANVQAVLAANKIREKEEELASLSEKFSAGMSGLLFEIRFDRQTPSPIKEIAYELEQTMKAVMELQKELARCTQS
jgi:hypothetical protein